MELQEKITKMERVSARMMSAGGNVLGKLTLFTLSVYEFAKLIKYLVKTW